MKIIDTTGSGLTVLITPDYCLLLANACRLALGEADDGALANTPEQVIEGALYLTLAALFDAYAVVGQAINCTPPKDIPGLDLAHIRSAWGVLPGDRKAS
jgi:hypothetical protein